MPSAIEKNPGKSMLIQAIEVTLSRWIPLNHPNQFNIATNKTGDFDYYIYSSREFTKTCFLSDFLLYLYHQRERIRDRRVGFLFQLEKQRPIIVIVEYTKMNPESIKQITQSSNTLSISEEVVKNIYRGLRIYVINRNDMLNLQPLITSLAPVYRGVIEVKPINTIDTIELVVQTLAYLKTGRTTPFSFLFPVKNLIYLAYQGSVIPLCTHFTRTLGESSPFIYSETQNVLSNVIDFGFKTSLWMSAKLSHHTINKLLLLIYLGKKLITYRLPTWADHQHLSLLKRFGVYLRWWFGFIALMGIGINLILNINDPSLDLVSTALSFSILFNRSLQPILPGIPSAFSFLLLPFLYNQFAYNAIKYVLQSQFFTVPLGFHLLQCGGQVSSFIPDETRKMALTTIGALAGFWLTSKMSYYNIIKLFLFACVSKKLGAYNSRLPQLTRFTLDTRTCLRLLSLLVSIIEIVLSGDYRYLIILPVALGISVLLDRRAGRIFPEILNTQDLVLLSFFSYQITYGMMEYTLQYALFIIQKWQLCQSALNEIKQSTLNIPYHKAYCLGYYSGWRFWYDRSNPLYLEWAQNDFHAIQCEVYQNTTINCQELVYSSVPVLTT